LRPSVGMIITAALLAILKAAPNSRAMRIPK
jgi:hypothetical protein